MLSFAGLWLGLPPAAALIVAACLALSSTAIVMEVLSGQRRMMSTTGRTSFAILLAQDLAVVPLLIVIPALSKDSGDLLPAMALAFAKAALALTVLLVVGQRFMRSWFHIVATQKSSELFMLNVLFITLGLAYVTELAGLSMALGAFIAGMLISETEYRYQVEDDIKPFRDVLLGLFFITIGMRLDPASVAQDWLWVLVFVLGGFALKVVVIAGLGRVFRRLSPRERRQDGEQQRQLPGEVSPRPLHGRAVDRPHGARVVAGQQIEVLVVRRHVEVGVHGHLGAVLQPVVIVPVPGDE